MVKQSFCFFPFSKISFDSVLGFSFPQPNLTNPIPHLVYWKNFLLVFSTSDSSLSSSKPIASLARCRPLPWLRMLLQAWFLTFQVSSLTHIFTYLPASDLRLSTIPSCTWDVPATVLFSDSPVPCHLHHVYSPINTLRSSTNASFSGKHSLVPSRQNLSPPLLCMSLVIFIMSALADIYTAVTWLDCTLLRTEIVSCLPSDPQSVAQSLTYTNHLVNINGPVSPT